MKLNKIIFLFFCLCFFSCSLMALTRIIQVVPSPDKKLKAVVFLRGFGATTFYSPRVSILKSNQKIYGSGNAFQGYDSVFIDIKWLDNSTLQITHSSEYKWIQKNSRKIYGVKIIDKYQNVIEENVPFPIGVQN